MKSALAALALGLAATPATAAQGLAAIAGDFAEARRAGRHGDALWPGFSAAPFGLLLIEDQGETLLCDKRLPAGFAAAGRSAQLGCAVATGPPSWRKSSLLAAMPVFGPGEVIVMGTPAATGLAPAAWRRTVLHEHFHQWQGALPDIYRRIDGLGLAGGDETGMWMLNYPFPYDRDDVAAKFVAASAALVAALGAPDRELVAGARAYLAARSALQATVSERDWRYFDFQLWKEGVARWTELEIARRAGGGWARQAKTDWTKLVASLARPRLAEDKRVAFYAFGAAEAALLERIDGDWRGCYRVVTTLTPCWDGLKIKLGRD